MATKAGPSFREILGDTPAGKLDQPCQDEHLCEIACLIIDWPGLAPRMGITVPEMEEIRGKWPFSIGGQRMEFLRKWKEKNGKKGTYRRLCKAFWKVSEVALAEKVCDVLCSQQSSSESSSDECTPVLKKAKLLVVPDPMPGSTKGESFVQYCTDPLVPLPGAQNRISSSKIVSLGSLAGYLRMTYGSIKPSFVALQWPPPPTLKVFNLALIQSKETVRRRPLDENLVMLTVTGKVDDIMKIKTSIKLEDLFEGQGKKRKVVLVEGAPGSGKSTMAYDICQKWEAQELFHDKFKIAIYVQFRDLEVQSAQEIADLLPMELESDRRAATSLLKDCYGEDVLFVLDGWDEYSGKLQEGSLFEKLICRPEMLSVQRSTVLITSRPVASGNLQKYATSRVEIVGFTAEEVDLYFKEIFSDTATVQNLHDHLQERPLIKASCYLPLNAAIVAHLFMELNYTLPSNLHDLFSSLVLSCIIRHLTKESQTEPDITSLDSLPPDVQETFQKVCTIAFKGAMHNKVIFSTEDLQSYGLQKDLNTLSLMQVVQSLTTGKPKTYHFLHLSMEELLAAKHISTLPPLQQVRVFTKLFRQPRFNAVFRYYAAFTKLQTEGIRDIVSRLVQSAVSDNERPWFGGMEKGKIQLLNLMHCLYEAGDRSLCQFVSFKLEGVLDLSSSTLSPFDLYSLKYFLSCVDISVGPAGHIDTDSDDGTISKLKLNDCNLTLDDINFLSLRNLAELNLLSNRLSCACATNIITNNSKLKVIQLGCCGLTDDGVELFAAALRDHHSLEFLGLGSWAGSIYGMHHVLQAVRFHPSLRILSITKSHVDMKDVAAVLEVNSSLRDMVLGTSTAKEGTIITANDSVILATSLVKNKTLKRLTLYVYNADDWLYEFVWNLRESYLQTLRILIHSELSLLHLIDPNVLHQEGDRVNRVRRQVGLLPLELRLHH